jgi:DNA-binding transcriptional LysR family regulator
MKPQAQPVRPTSPRLAPSFELRHLRYFLAVAEELNFTRAAHRLNVAQQTLSEGIAQLEEMLALQLFERATRPVGLTDAAAQWLPYAREALAAAERADDAAVELRPGAITRLRVGLAATAAFPLTPTLLETFRLDHPHIALSTRHFDFGDPAGGLLTGKADVAIVRPPFTATGLELLVIASEPRYVALSDDHPLARRTRVSFGLESSLRVCCLSGRDDSSVNDRARCTELTRARSRPRCALPRIRAISPRSSSPAPKRTSHTGSQRRCSPPPVALRDNPRTMSEESTAVAWLRHPRERCHA